MDQSGSDEYLIDRSIALIGYSPGICNLLLILGAGGGASSNEGVSLGMMDSH